MTAKTITLEPAKYHAAEPENSLLNLGWPERYASIAGGVLLAYLGLKNIFKSPLFSIMKLSAGGYLLNRGVTGHCEISSQIQKFNANQVNINIRSSFMIHKPRHEVYAFWRRFDNLPLFMTHLKKVVLLDNDRSRWVIKLPKGIPNLSWESEIIKDKPDEMISWHSVPGSIVENAGKVRFRDGNSDDSTRVDILITYQPPAGSIGARLARVFTPIFKKMVERDVRNFKHYMDIDYATDTVNYL